MSAGTQMNDGNQESDVRRVQQEIAGQIARARAALALAHRHASKLPLTAEEQEKSQRALADAIGLCVMATHAAKKHSLYKIADSGLNPSELRRSAQRGLSRNADGRGRGGTSRRARPAAAQSDRSAAPLLVQLDASRRMNVEGMRCLTQLGTSREGAWRGGQLLRIAEQLCVITAMESKLMGVYVLSDARTDPAAARAAVCQWATEATRKEIEAE